MLRSQLTNREYDLLMIANSFAAIMTLAADLLREADGDLKKDVCNRVGQLLDDVLAAQALFFGDTWPVEIIDDRDPLAEIVQEPEKPASTIEGIWYAMRAGQLGLAWKIVYLPCAIAIVFVRRQVKAAIIHAKFLPKTIWLNLKARFFA